MTIRTRLILYLVIVHVAFGAISFIALAGEWVWLVVVELAFLLSVILGARTIRAFFVPLELIAEGTELIDERDFSVRFRESGVAELDALVRVYNRMIETLRDERLRLEEQGLLLDRIVDASPAAILITDFDGRISEANRSAESRFGPQTGGLIGKRVEELDHPVARRLTTLEAGESAVVPAPGGRQFRCSRVTFFDRGFDRDAYLIDELTDEIHASEKQAYGQVIRMMSHEVRNSVGAVRSLLDSSLHYAEQLDGTDQVDFRDAVAVASARLENLERFVRGFADVVRLPSPERRPVDLNQLLRDVITLMTPMLESRRIVTRLMTPETPVVVLLDKNQFEQVVVNVVRNAMESIGENGRIEILLEPRDHRAALSIRDTGEGISPEVLPRLFSPFMTTRKNGQGLGLTLTREILDGHGFAFELRNLPEGGAEMWISMPERESSSA